MQVNIHMKKKIAHSHKLSDSHKDFSFTHLTRPVSQTAQHFILNRYQTKPTHKCNRSGVTNWWSNSLIVKLSHSQHNTTWAESKKIWFTQASVNQSKLIPPTETDPFSSWRSYVQKEKIWASWNISFYFIKSTVNIKHF